MRRRVIKIWSVGMMPYCNMAFLGNHKNCRKKKLSGKIAFQYYFLNPNKSSIVWVETGW